MQLDKGALAMVVASIAALIVPVVLHSGFPAGHDAPAHLTYVYLFDRALADGQFPVRWIEWVRAGHGQPLFNFYQPGLFYFVQMIHLAVPSLTVSLKTAVILVWWLGTTFMFLLTRRFGTVPAALAALVFAFSPYLVLDVFVRSAYPEMAGLAFAVGVLWALDEWLRTRRPIWLPVVAGLAGLMVLSHPPVALMVSPVVAAYAGSLLLARETTSREVAALAPAFLLGASLSAFYIVPAIAELHQIKSAALTSGGFDYHRHFVYPEQWVRFRWGFGSSVEGPGDGLSFQIGIAQWMALGAALGAASAALARRTSVRPAVDLYFWLASAGGAMFLMTRSSTMVWNMVPAMAFIQFPWRLLIVVAIAAAVLSARVLSLIRNRRVQAAIVMGATIVQVQLAHLKLMPKGYITSETIDIDRPEWGQSTAGRKNAFIEDGYFPTTLAARPPADLGRWTVVQGRATVTARFVKAHALDLAVDAAEPVVLRINAPAFPGWQVSVDGRRTATLPCGGYLAVAVPAGHHQVSAIFSDTPVRSCANALSVASAVALAAACLRLREPRRRMPARRQYPAEGRAPGPGT